MVWGKAAQWLHRKKKEKEEKEEVSLLYFFQKFKALLRHNNRALELMADMGEKLSGDYLFDRQYIESVVRELGEEVGKVIYNLNLMAPKDFAELFDAFEKAEEEVQAELDLGFAIPRGEDIYFLSALDEEMSDHVGNKMATLAQLRNRLGLPVPDGFVISTQAYKKFMEANLKRALFQLVFSWEVCWILLPKPSASRKTVPIWKEGARNFRSGS